MSDVTTMKSRIITKNVGVAGVAQFLVSSKVLLRIYETLLLLRYLRPHKLQYLRVCRPSLKYIYLLTLLQCFLNRRLARSPSLTSS